MGFDISYDVIYRNLYLADTLYYADTTAFPEGVRLIQVSLYIFVVTLIRIINFLG